MIVRIVRKLSNKSNFILCRISKANVLLIIIFPNIFSITKSNQQPRAEETGKLPHCITRGSLDDLFVTQVLKKHEFRGAISASGDSKVGGSKTEERET